MHQPNPPLRLRRSLRGRAHARHFVGKERARSRGWDSERRTTMCLRRAVGASCYYLASIRSVPSDRCKLATAAELRVQAWLGARAAHHRQARWNAAPSALDVSSPLNKYLYGGRSYQVIVSPFHLCPASAVNYSTLHHSNFMNHLNLRAGVSSTEAPSIVNPGRVVLVRTCHI